MRTVITMAADVRRALDGYCAARRRGQSAAVNDLLRQALGLPIPPLPFRRDRDGKETAALAIITANGALSVRKLHSLLVATCINRGVSWVRVKRQTCLTK